jgi:ATP-dependent helicase HrpA
LLALADYIQKQTSLKLSVSDFDLSDLTEHLKMNFSVVDETGRELGMGRDWNALKAQLGSAAQLTFRNSSPSMKKRG